MRTYIIEMTEEDDFCNEYTTHNTVSADCLRVTETDFLFQVYDDKSSSFHTVAVFERHEKRRFNITSKD